MTKPWGPMQVAHDSAVEKIAVEELALDYLPNNQMPWLRLARLFWSREEQMMLELLESIDKNGVLNPVKLLKETRRILDGHHRIVCAMRLDLPEVPVIYVRRIG